MSDTFDVPRVRSDSTSTTTSTSSLVILRQRLAQLLVCLEDLSSDDEANEEVSHTLDKAFYLCGKYTNRESFRLHVVTWNVGTAEPPADVRSLLQLYSQPATDLFVIGLQEVNATPVRYISDLISEDSWSHLLMDTLAPMGYIKVTSVRMQGLLLILLAKQVHLPFIRDIQSTYTRTGLFGYWGNKGGVSVRFSFYGHMLCFLNCHLAAHMNYVLQRMDEFEYILDRQDFDMYNTPQVLDHKVVFCFGDLNFRIADHGMHFLRSSINNGRFNLLWNRDQLTMMKKKEPILQEFEEGPLCFKPTYKFDRFSETYDISGKKRKPAWTDRILWRIKPKATETEDENRLTSSSADDDEHPIKVTQEMYTCDVSYGVSDHKPVIATLNLEMRKNVETPLVTLTVEGHWSADEDATFTYTILENFESSTWDWIGLYKIGFKRASDYSTFAWVKDDEVAANGEVVTVQMSKNELNLLAGDYVLGYYSTNMQTLVAFSPTFQILESRQAVMEGLLPENINGYEK
ncbi:inositol polyphosphate 5-phosphatase K-like isoform X2 [Sinocyclocheilus rhinocerous]|uniref:inositol polyphosphate 5-phosphatase K-like isoform X2 n=1 Tax=Sinocyclocheilus rhinocerous TaxID=307959 RepID=UPI0007BAC119|nr:PREDICTED: inositol polyphosphate 5-phosphatase K-like isoform X2 [Sinocyclocheilus rhinocerous]